MEINGKPVVDGKKKWWLSIYDVDITTGRNKDPGNCAAARAILREHSEIRSVRVHIGRVFVELDKVWERYQTPHSLRSEIVAFDRGGSFMPGVHKILPVAPSTKARMKYHQKNYDKIKKTKKIAKKRRYNLYGVRSRGATR
jgi:hypothetical protein